MFLAPDVAVYQQPASNYLIIEKKYHDYSNSSRQINSGYEPSYNYGSSYQQNQGSSIAQKYDY